MSDVDPLEEAMAGLRRDYLTESAARLLELRKDYAAVLACEPEAALSLKGRFHKLAGSGGSYGFPEVSSLARKGEQWMSTHAEDLGQAASVLSPLLEDLESAFQS